MIKNMLDKLKVKQNKKGFTLVEIIVVLVILAILAAIAIPSVLGYVEDARKTQYIAEARSIYLIVQTEEAKMRAEKGVGTISEETNLDYQEVFEKLCNKSSTYKNGQGYAAKVTGLPKVMWIYHNISNEYDLCIIQWESTNGHIIVANVYKNQKVEIQSIDAK